MKINIREWSRLSPSERSALLRRAETAISDVTSRVQAIIEAVEKRGNAAVIDFCREFDGIDLMPETLRVSEAEVEEAGGHLAASVKRAIDQAIADVRKYHEFQKPRGMRSIQTVPGLLVGERFTPIPSVGLYVPRGKGSFPSMLYMLAVPAQVAGVRRVCVTTPCGADGAVDAASLYAARQCGVHEVYRIGGAQGIAALALGTETIDPVSKIIGPGSPYVTAAQRLVHGRVATGTPAGPTESLLLADESADPKKVALDLLIEAEHGPDTAAMLVTPSRALADAVASAVIPLAEELPEPRRGFVATVLAGFGGVLVTQTLDEAIDFVNLYAPEHLQIQTREPFALVERIANAGEILVGEHTPFSLANYAAGANAVLPTGGHAATSSAVSVRDFMKSTSIVYSDSRALEFLGQTVTTLADYEEFPAHAAAIRKRSNA